MIWDRQEIIAHYRDAKDKREAIKIIAQCNACHPDAIIDLLNANGIDTPAPRKKRGSINWDAIDKAMYGGMSAPAAAKHFGVSVNTIHNHRKARNQLLNMYAATP